jgi:hypothetical protein
MMTPGLKRSFTLFLPAVFMMACEAHIPTEALLLKPESLQERQLQTRVFDTGNEEAVLGACSSLLQDLGFNIDESETELGIIVGSKDRSAVQAGQVVASVLVGVLTGVVTPIDKNQKMRASVVTKPAGDQGQRISVRVTFQRMVWNTQGRVTVREGLRDQAIYREFFDKLAKSLFLEAQQI